MAIEKLKIIYKTKK